MPFELHTRFLLCRELLELVLDRKVGELACVNRQKPIEITANGKGVRFDVYAEGNDSVIYEIEMQNASIDSIAKRSRILSLAMKLRRYSFVHAGPQTMFQRKCRLF